MTQDVCDVCNRVTVVDVSMDLRHCTQCGSLYSTATCSRDPGTGIVCYDFTRVLICVPADRIGMRSNNEDLKEGCDD